MSQLLENSAYSANMLVLVFCCCVHREVLDCLHQPPKIIKLRKMTEVMKSFFFFLMSFLEGLRKTRNPIMEDLHVHVDF